MFTKLSEIQQIKEIYTHNNCSFVQDNISIVAPKLKTYLLSEIEKYEGLSIKDRLKIDEIVSDVVRILEIYKFTTHMYPDWTNINKKDMLLIPDTCPISDHLLLNRFTILENIQMTTKDIIHDFGFFVMSRIVDDLYNNIPNYRRNINRPIHCAIWHIACALNFEKIINYRTELPKNDYYNTSTANKFFRLFDVFCIISRQKTTTEFDDEYKIIYQKITGVGPGSNENNTMIQIQQKYNQISIPYLYIYNPSLTAIPLLQKIGPKELLVLLNRKFSNPMIQLDKVYNNTITQCNLQKNDASEFVNNQGYGAWNEKHDILTKLSKTTDIIQSKSIDKKKINIKNNQNFYNNKKKWYSYIPNNKPRMSEVSNNWRSNKSK